MGVGREDRWGGGEMGVDRDRGRWGWGEKTDGGGGGRWGG